MFTRLTLSVVATGICYDVHSHNRGARGLWERVTAAGSVRWRRWPVGWRR
jgi:hypothetical protein